MSSEGCRFLFGIHCHQPVGNFPGVIEQIYNMAYRPTMEVLGRFPSCRFVAHYTGPLLEWLAEKHPEHLEMLGDLAKRGQAEILGGGFYEPILAAIPSRDRREQLQRLRDFWGERLGEAPRGAWLAERVWSPELADDLAEAGYGYVLLDDDHFQGAGVPAEELNGHYLTEAGGKTVGVLPIAKRLRYLIPFRPVEEAVAELARWRGAAVLVDDGEKFGAWPNTYAWVHEGGWLSGFLAAVDSHPGISMERIGDYLDRVPPMGYIYLPTTSYAEMGEWSLPAPAAARLADLRQSADEQAGSYLRGGTFPNFFVKYPEGGYLRQRVLAAGKLGALRQDAVAAEHLLRAQCNDAYWHGVFGGIYLPHLRRALWAELIAAEGGLPPDLWTADLDGDGFAEIFCRAGEGTFCLRPRDGGTLREWSLKVWGANLGDVLARRPEGYHLRGGGGGRPAEGVASIHQHGGDPLEVGDYDECLRSAFRDEFRAAGAPVGGFATGDYEAQWRVEGQTAKVRLRRADGSRWVEKEFCWPFGQRRLEVGYRVAGEPGDLFRVEVPLALPAGDSPAGTLLVDGKVVGGFGGVLEMVGREIECRDAVAGGNLRLEVTPPADLKMRPARTLARSEQGAEEVMQGLVLELGWTVGDGEEKLVFKGSWDGSEA